MFKYFFLFSLSFSANLWSMDVENDKGNFSDSFSDSFEGLSDYEDEVIKNANLAFIYEKEEEFDKLEDPLKKAAEGRYRYALYSYAHWLLSPDILSKSPEPLGSVHKACDYILMAAYRGVEDACYYVEELEERAKSLNKKIGIMDLLSQARHDEREKQHDEREKQHDEREKQHDERKKWLKGEYSDYKAENFPDFIREARELLFLSILPEIDSSIFDKFNEELKEKILSLNNEKRIFKGRNVQDLNRYVEKLGMKISSGKKNYSGKPQGELPDGEYAYFNTNHKYFYCLDIGVRAWNHAIGGLFLKNQKDKRFVQTNAMPAAAGPIYDSLRRKKTSPEKPSSEKNINLSPSTAFVVKNYYDRVVPLFKNAPELLVEITHMEKPWKNTNEMLKVKYEGKWPNLSSPKKDKKAFNEIEKNKELTKKFNEEIETFVAEEEVRKSISYRLFMLCMADAIKTEKHDGMLQEQSSPKDKEKKRKRSKSVE